MLDKNAGLPAVVNERAWRVEFSIPLVYPPWRVKQIEAVTPSNVPFLGRVSGMELDSAISSRAARSFRFAAVRRHHARTRRSALHLSEQAIAFDRRDE